MMSVKWPLIFGPSLLLLSIHWLLSWKPQSLSPQQSKLMVLSHSNVGCLLVKVGQVVDGFNKFYGIYPGSWLLQSLVFTSPVQPPFSSLKIHPLPSSFFHSHSVHYSLGTMSHSIGGDDWRGLLVGWCHFCVGCYCC